MSLIKRGRIWQCEWKVGGKRIRETTGTADAEAAQEYHDRRRAELWRESRLGDTRVITWDEAALQWVDEHAESKRSYESDRLRLIWLSKELSGKTLTEIDSISLIAMRKNLMVSRKASTANRFLAIVSAVMNYAKDKGQVVGVPTIPYLSEDSGDFFLWATREQAQKLIAALPEPLCSMTRFALATGLRRGNVTGLQWSNLDTERRVTWVWAGRAKGNKHFSVPLNDDAIAVLQQQRALPAAWNKDGTKLRDPGHVFTYRGRPIYHATTKAWEKAVAKAGIPPGFTFHDLRHTWASWHVMAGTPLPVLQQLGAWASLDMVLRYAHLAPGYVAEYAGNSSLLPQNHPQSDLVSGHSRGNAGDLGWLMGLEPTTTGITIPDSTN